MKRTLAIYGATGTIGDNALALVDHHPDHFDVAVLTAHTNIKKLARLARHYQPHCVVLTGGSPESFYDLYPDYKGDVLVGAAGLLEATQHRVDIALMAIVGFAALPPTFALLKQKTSLALANKECLVVAGALLMKTAHEMGVQILPVDSEHNAIFQLLMGRDIAQVEKIVLTASGGPFRQLCRADMAKVTPEQAVRHPNWQMGAKISVDSATLMNKGLELIEAHYLFDVDATQLDVLVHPESIVHGLVYFTDGAVFAQKSPPDMRVPLASALAWQHHLSANTPPLDLARIGALTFEAADRARFPCLKLAEQALAASGAAPIILNAANEVAVEHFLNQRIGFLDIEALIADALAQDINTPTHAHELEAIIACDAAVREFCVNHIRNRL